MADQVMYQRAFEALIWSVPAMIKDGMRRASIEVGAGGNVVMAWSGGASSLFIDVVGRPLTPVSVAGVARRTTRRTVRRALY